MKNKMIKDKIPFTQIPNELIVDDISPGAKNVYMYMQSKPSDWDFWNCNIKKALHIKTDSTISGYLKELLLRGWISRKRKRIDGKISGGFDYTVHFERKNLKTEKLYIKKKSTLRKNHHHSNTKYISNTNKDSNKEEEGKIKDFPEFSTIVHGFIKHQTNIIGKKLIPASQSTIKNSIKTLDRLKRIDGFTIDEIKGTLHFALQDDFWKDQVYSLAGLRNKSKNGLSKFQNIYAQASKTLKKQFIKNEQKQKEDEISERLGI